MSDGRFQYDATCAASGAIWPIGFAAIDLAIGLAVDCSWQVGKLPQRPRVTMNEPVKCML